MAKFEDLIEEASAELDRVEAQLQTASQEKVVLQTGNAQLMRQAQESAAVKAQASHNGAVVVWLDTGTVAVSSCCCCRQAIAHPKLLARNMPLHLVQQYKGQGVVVGGAHPLLLHLHCQHNSMKVKVPLLTVPILF